MLGVCSDVVSVFGGVGGSFCLCCGIVAWFVFSWLFVSVCRFFGFSL